MCDYSSAVKRSQITRRQTGIRTIPTVFVSIARQSGNKTHFARLVHRGRWRLYLCADRHHQTKYTGREYTRSRDIHMHTRVCARASIAREIHNRPPRILSSVHLRATPCYSVTSAWNIDRRARPKKNRLLNIETRALSLERTAFPDCGFVDLHTARS